MVLARAKSGKPNFVHHGQCTIPALRLGTSILNSLHVLAKQVLSQLSYTPTAGTAIDVKAFAAVRKLQKLTFCSLLCQNCVKTPVVRPLLCQNS
jgi:hypothetical protein